MLSSAIGAYLNGFSYLLSFPGPLFHPAHYRFLMESPLAADSEAWNHALSGQLVHGGRMNLQQVADFFQGQEGIISHGIDARPLWGIWRRRLNMRAIAVPRSRWRLSAFIGLRQAPCAQINPKIF